METLCENAQSQEQYFTHAFFLMGYFTAHDGIWVHAENLILSGSEKAQENSMFMVFLLLALIIIKS